MQADECTLTALHTCWRTGAGKTPCKGWGIWGDLRISLRGPQQPLDHDDGLRLPMPQSALLKPKTWILKQTLIVCHLRDSLTLFFFSCVSFFFPRIRNVIK